MSTPSLHDWVTWQGLVRPAIVDLTKRGNVTLNEYHALGCNGIEAELIAPHLTDEAFVEYAESRLAAVTYNQPQFIDFTVPELIKRLRTALERIAAHDRMHLSYDVKNDRYQVGNIEVSALTLSDTKAAAVRDYRKSKVILSRPYDESENAVWRARAIRTIRQHRLTHPDLTPPTDYAEKAADASMRLSEPDVTPPTPDDSR